MNERNSSQKGIQVTNNVQGRGLQVGKLTLWNREETQPLTQRVWLSLTHVYLIQSGGVDKIGSTLHWGPYVEESILYLLIYVEFQNQVLFNIVNFATRLRQI